MWVLDLFPPATMHEALRHILRPPHPSDAHDLVVHSFFLPDNSRPSHPELLPPTPPAQPSWRYPAKPIHLGALVHKTSSSSQTPLSRTAAAVTAQAVSASFRFRGRPTVADTHRSRASSNHRSHSSSSSFCRRRSYGSPSNSLLLYTQMARSDHWP